MTVLAAGSTNPWSETTLQQLQTIARQIQNDGEALGEYHVASHMLPTIVAGES
jgi:hypothetical protein